MISDEQNAILIQIVVEWYSDRRVAGDETRARGILKSLPESIRDAVMDRLEYDLPGTVIKPSAKAPPGPTKKKVLPSAADSADFVRRQMFPTEDDKEGGEQ